MRCRHCKAQIKETPWKTSALYIHLNGWFRCGEVGEGTTLAQPEEDE